MGQDFRPAQPGDVLTVVVRRRDAEGAIVEDVEVPLTQLVHLAEAEEAKARLAGYALPLDTGSTRPPAAAPDGR